MSRKYSYKLFAAKFRSQERQIPRIVAYLLLDKLCRKVGKNVLPLRLQRRFLTLSLSLSPALTRAIQFGLIVGSDM